jgi:NAD(P)-dependent dehydrogenase (short-subunit alcohol dehydrogenase family)
MSTSSDTKKKVLVVGSTGATGKHVVQFLLNQGHHVVAVARSKEKMMSVLSTQNQDENRKNLTVKEMSISMLSPTEGQELTGGCDAIVRYVDSPLVWFSSFKLVAIYENLGFDTFLEPICSYMA